VSSCSRATPRPISSFFALFYGNLRVNFISRSAAIWLCYIVLCDRCSSVSSASTRISVSTLLSRNKLGRVRNSVARSRNHCWRGNGTMYSVCTVELHVTCNNIKIFIVNTTMLLRWICVAGYSNTYFGLHVKCSIFLVQFEPDLMEFINRFDGIYWQIWWNLSTDLMEFINRFGGIYRQIWWNLSTHLMEFIDRFHGICRQIWWNLSTDLMEYIDRFDGIYRQIWWNLSIDLMEYIDRFYGIYQQIWWNISTDLLEFIDRFDGIYQQIWWNLSTDLMEFINRFDGIYRQILWNLSTDFFPCQISRKSVQRERHWYLRTDGQTDMAKLIVAFHEFLLITNLTHFFMYLFHLSTCFEHHSAHHQEIELY